MKRVLFIDVRNTARSIMAEAWFNHLVKRWGKASSCGTMPSAEPDPLTKEVLRAAGVRVRGSTPKPVRQNLMTQADIIILLGHDLPKEAFSPFEVWSFQDPTGESIEAYRRFCDQVSLRVQLLIQRLQPAAERPRPEDLDLKQARQALWSPQIWIEDEPEPWSGAL